MKNPHLRLDVAARFSMLCYSISAMVLPVSLVAINREMGFSLTQAGSLGFVGSLLLFITLVGSIYLAAFLGKIRSLQLGLVFLGLGLLMFTSITGYIHAILIIVVISLGSGVLEGLLTPLVEDVHPNDDGTRQLLLHSFWPIGIVIGTLAIGEVLSYGINWRWPYAVLFIICLVASATYPRTTQVSLPPSRSDFSHAGEIFRSPRFWQMGLALFFAGASEGGFTFWIASYIQIEFISVARAGAVGLSIFALGMVVGRIFTSRLASRFSLRSIILFCIIINFFTGLFLFLAGNLILLYLIGGLFGLSMAPMWPGIQTWAVRRMEVDPTMTMILLSCLGILGFSSSTFTMGIVGDYIGLRFSLLVLPLTTAILLLIVLFIRPSGKNSRSLGNRKNSGQARE